MSEVDVFRVADRARLQALQFVLDTFEDFSDPATAREYLLPYLRSEVTRLTGLTAGNDPNA